MTFTHIPAHTTYHHDRFVDEATGLGYEVSQDTCAEDPRNWTLDSEVALWAYSESRSARPTGNLAIDAFARYYEETGCGEKALGLTRRYLAAFHADSKILIDTATIHGYAQSDWMDVVCASTEGFGSPEGHISEYRQWAFGDVWVVVPDKGAPMGGIYADDAEAALKFFLEDYDPNQDPATADDLEQLEPLAPSDPDQDYSLSWEIDAVDAANAAGAARDIWRSIFGRGPGQPGPDEACVFTVTQAGRSTQIDLSEERYAALFED